MSIGSRVYLSTPSTNRMDESHTDEVRACGLISLPPMQSTSQQLTASYLGLIFNHVAWYDDIDPGLFSQAEHKSWWIATCKVFCVAIQLFFAG